MTYKPKVIFFDWNKTLSVSLFWSHMNPYSGHKYASYHKKLITALFVDNKNLINPWMRGEYDTKQIMDILSPLVGLSSKILEEELIISCKNQSYVDPVVPKLIGEVKNKGIKVVIATDNMDTFRNYTVPSMNLETLFDDLLISCELKTLKGDHDEDSIPFFNQYLSKNDLTYKDVVLLDDCTDETGVYEKLGLKINQITSSKVLVSLLKAYAKS